MNSIQKSAALLMLTAIMLSFATPVYAFDGRTGDSIIIQANEVVKDDLYIGAQNLTVDGTIQGDLVAGAETVIINGTVEGDLIVGAQTVIINGTVGDDARVGAAAIQVGPQASIGGDLIALGASVETRPGSDVAEDLVTGSAQVLLAGKVGGDLLAGTNALELHGPVGGNVRAYVDMTAESANAQPFQMHLNDMPITIPAVKPGLKLAQGAKIGGSLDYTSSVDAAIPAGIVAGKVTRIPPAAHREGVRVVRTPTAAERVGDWAIGVARSMLILILFGLLLGWLFPRFMKMLPANLRTEPIVSLGWGAILFAAVFFTVLAIVLATILLVVLGMGWNIVGLAWLLLTLLGAGFFLATSYLAKIVVGDAVGRWILGRFNPALVEHKVWPMVVGVAAMVLAIGLLRFPLLPIGFFGWLLNFVVILFGLGAMWTWGRQAWTSRAAAI